MAEEDSIFFSFPSCQMMYCFNGRRYQLVCRCFCTCARVGEGIIEKAHAWCYILMVCRLTEWLRMDQRNSFYNQRRERTREEELGWQSVDSFIGSCSWFRWCFQKTFRVLHRFSITWKTDFEINKYKIRIVAVLFYSMYSFPSSKTTLPTMQSNHQRFRRVSG